MLRAGPDSTDQELVEAAKRDRGAFAHLYDRYVDRIYSYAYHRTGNRELAEDVTADTFRSAIEGLARYEWRGVPFAAWLYRIASNNIAMHYRKAVPQDSIDDMDLPAHDAESPESLAERGERAAMLKKAMAGLTAEQQQVVTLRFGQGLKAAQIGLIMDKSEGAVKLLLHRAMRSMQRHLRAEMM